MTWVDVGPTLTPERLALFEERLGRKVPHEVVWFLRNVCNGGDPSEEFYVQTDERNEPTDVETIVGIDHPDFDLHFLMSKCWEHAHLWPVAYDCTSGTFVLELAGRHKGQVRYLRPWAESRVPDPHETFFVAKDIRDFARMLKGPSAPLPPDWDG